MRQAIRPDMIFCGVALSFTVALAPMSYALNPINSTQDGRIIQGGTYYNTAGNTTSFINSHSGGLWLKAGTTLRGLEVNSSGNLDNNGGTVHLYAPDNVVRVDGNIDVNAIRNGQGAYLGNGGKVFIDSGYLFQNGNIFANGANGGLVQVNVAGMTLGAGAQIQAKGSTGAGGTVAINSAGPVDLRLGALIDTSGKVLGTLDSNLINIEGGLVNNEGTLRADGVASRGGSIRLVASGQSPYQDIKDSLQAATVNPPGDTTAPTISVSERTALLQRTKGLIDTNEGQVFLSRDTSSSTPSFISNLSVNGTGGNVDNRNDTTQSPTSRAGDGGNITLLAMQGIQNLGNIRANGSAGRSGTSPVNGGNGGTISIVSQAGIANAQGRLEANGGNGGASTGTTAGGKGGDGGLISFGYNGTMTNTGGLYADGALGGNGTHPGRGGNGGLMVFSGNTNPTGNGSLDVIGRPGGNNNLNLGGKAGTIVSPNPGTLGQTQVYFQQGYVNGQLVRNRATQATQPVELLTHAENLIMLTKNGGNLDVSSNLFERLNQARIRSVTDPTGALGQARNEVIFKNTPVSSYVFRNLILGSNRDNLDLEMTHPYHYGDPSDNPGPILILPSSLSNGLGFSTLNTLSIVDNGGINNGPYESALEFVEANVGLWQMGHNDNAGGRMSILAKGDINASDPMGTNGLASGGSVHMASISGIHNGAFTEAGKIFTNGELHGGSVLLKAQNSIDNQINTFFSGSGMQSNGGLLGGTLRLYSKSGGINTQATGGDTRATLLSANGNAWGGIITASSGGSINNVGTIQANGLEGSGGYINLHSDNSVYNFATVTFPFDTLAVIEANGAVKGGTVILTAGDRIAGNEGRTSGVNWNQAYFGTPQNRSTFFISQLTPPVTSVGTITDLDRSESVYNLGNVNALGGSPGRNGKIYIAANKEVTFGEFTGRGSFNNVPLDYNQILSSSNRNQAFQNALLPTQNNGGRVYIVAGQALTNRAGQTRNAVDATNEAASTKSAPNVNPNQNGQGALLPNDFFLPNP